MECGYSQNIIKKCCELLEVTNKTKQGIGHNELLFGTGEPKIDDLLLIIKLYIYKCRLNNGMFSVNTFQNEIAEPIKADSIFMTKEKFSTKWQGLEHLANCLNIYWKEYNKKINQD